MTTRGKVFSAVLALLVVADLVLIASGSVLLGAFLLFWQAALAYWFLARTPRQ